MQSELYDLCYVLNKIKRKLFLVSYNFFESLTRVPQKNNELTLFINLLK